MHFSQSFGRRRAMVAVRNAALRHCAGEQLRAMGLDVLEAGSGAAVEDGLAAANKSGMPFDWLLMDAAMQAPGGARRSVASSSSARRPASATR